MRIKMRTDKGLEKVIVRNEGMRMRIKMRTDKVNACIFLFGIRMVTLNQTK